MHRQGWRINFAQRCSFYGGSGWHCRRLNDPIRWIPYQTVLGRSCFNHESPLSLRPFHKVLAVALSALEKKACSPPKRNRSFWDGDPPPPPPPYTDESEWYIALEGAGTEAFSYTRVVAAPRVESGSSSKSERKIDLATYVSWTEWLASDAYM